MHSRPPGAAAKPGAVGLVQTSAGNLAAMTIPAAPPVPLLRAFATVSGMTMLSRVAGFVRDMLIAAFLGAGPVSDAFFVAFKLPNFFRSLFAEGAFSAAFVPMFSATLTRQDRQAAIRFAEDSLAVLLTVLVLFTAACEVAMPLLMLVLAPGFADDPARFDAAVEFTRITFPYLLFISVVSLCGGVLNALGRFAAVAAAPILLNLTMIASLLLLTPLLPNPGYALAWGVLLSGIVQFVWLLWACAREGVPLRLRLPRLTAPVKRLLRLILPAAVGAGVTQVNLVVNVILASLLPSGAISYLFYADRLNQLPIGVVGVAVGTALLPLMSRQIAGGDVKAAIGSQNRAIELVLLLGLPATAALLAVPDPIIAVLFERGAFTAEDRMATAAALQAYSLGLPAYLLIRCFTPGFYARHDTRTPVAIAIAAMASNLVLSLALMWSMGYVGLALAAAASAWLNGGLLALVSSRRGLWRPDGRLLSRGARILAATLAMTAAVAAIAYLLQPWFAPGSLARQVAALAALVLGGGLVYAGAALALGAARPGELRSMLRRAPRRG